MICSLFCPSASDQAEKTSSTLPSWISAEPRRASASWSSSIGGGRSVAASGSEGARTPGRANGSGPSEEAASAHCRASARRSRSIQYQDIDSTMHRASCSSRAATAWRSAVRRFSYSRRMAAMAARCPAPRIAGPVVRASSRKWTRWRRPTAARSPASSRRSAAYSPTVSSSR
ncbi:hypothetical protein SBADM41S_10766 [Streptomyces badius]